MVVGVVAGKKVFQKDVVGSGVRLEFDGRLPPERRANG